MKETPQVEEFKRLYREYDEFKYPLTCKLRDPIYPPCIKERNTTNGLTKSIINFIRLMGWQSERISSMGRYSDNTEIVTNVIGQVKVIGSKQWIKSTSTNGTGDISSTIAGGSVKVEVKNAMTKDRKKQAQINYGVTIDISGGIYYIAKDFDTTIQWLMDNFKHNTNENKKILWQNVKLA